MVHQPEQAEEISLSLRVRIRKFWIAEKRLQHIGRSLLFHAAVALPLELLLIRLGVPKVCAILVAVTAAVTLENVLSKSEPEDSDD